MITSDTRYLIIGNSAGGIGAAEAIRRVDHSGLITIVSDEPYPAYSRPAIAEYLASPRPLEKILYRPPGFYEENHIQTLLGQKVVAIQPENHTVKLASGESLGWEKLLIATGGAPIIPALEGRDLKGVFTFNRLDDAKAIDAFLERHRRRVKAVVIGGGLIGMSVADALVRRNVSVTIVEMKGYILNTILDEEAAAIEAAAAGKAGVHIITGRTASQINSSLPGEVSGITLDDGHFISSEMVIIAIGVRPRLEAVHGSGLKQNRGIMVDRHMATSCPGIYACGDVAEAYDFITGENRLTPVWPNAYNGGRTAGWNMAGYPSVYQGGTAMNALKYFGQHIVSAGLTSAPDTTYETIVAKNNGTYRKMVLKDNRLAGFIFAGEIEKSGIVYNLMKQDVDVSNLKKLLVQPDFGLASLPANLRQSLLPQLPETPTRAFSLQENPEALPIGD